MPPENVRETMNSEEGTLQGTNISAPLKVAWKMIFLFRSWNMLITRRVDIFESWFIVIRFNHIIFFGN